MVRHKTLLLLALLGLVVVAAHGILGAAGIMTAAQWQSGVMIGGVVLLAGAGGALATR
jgi:hypothetical protein